MLQIAESIADFHALMSEGYYLADAYAVPPAREQEYCLDTKLAGKIPISLFQGTNVGVRRTWQHIRAKTSGIYVLWYPLEGTVSISQDGTHDRLIEPGEFAITCADRPFHARAMNGDTNRSAIMHVLVPSQMLRSHLPAVDRICARTFAASSGSAKIARMMFSGLLEESSRMDAETAGRLACSALEIAAGSVHHLMAPQPKLEAHSANAQLERVMRFIDQHLSHQGLTASVVANGCNMSRRYLHYLMSGLGETFGKYLWNRRLDQAQEWLRDKEFAHFNVVDIAYMCGFRSGSHFSTAYKDRFGRSPTDDR